LLSREERLSITKTNVATDGERNFMKTVSFFKVALAGAAIGIAVGSAHAAASSGQTSVDSVLVAQGTRNDAVMPAPNMTASEEAKVKAKRDARQDPNKKPATFSKQRGDEVLPSAEGMNPKSPETRNAELQERQAKRAERRGGKPPLVKVSPRAETSTMNH
jgi:hypothetical protein